ncbi:hypothetical protein H0H93_004424, partial [Arthromyces matolae]
MGSVLGPNRTSATLEDNSNLTLLKPELFAIQAMEGLVLVGEERSIVQEIRRGQRDGSMEEVVAKAAQALKTRSSSARSVRSDEWELQD